MNLLKSFSAAFRNAIPQKSTPHINQDKALCYYGGPEESTLNGFTIAVYVSINKELIYLPAETFDESVMEQFKDMQIGEAFYITEEDHDMPDPMCTNIAKIERISPVKIVQLPVRKGKGIALSGIAPS